MVDYIQGVQVLHAQQLYRHHFQTHWRGYGHFCFLLITEGTIYLQQKGGPRYEFSGPAAFWLHPRHEYFYGTIRKDRAWTHYFAAFTGPKAAALMESGFLQLNSKSFSTHVDLRYAESLFQDMIELIEQDAPFQDRACLARMEAYLLHLLERRAPAPTSSAYHQEILELTASLRSNPTEEVDFAAWARRHGMSYSNLRLQFRRVMRTSPQRYQDRVRFHWARQQLLSTATPIQEIGYQLGYENPSIFSRAFRRHFHISAQELRRLQQAN